MIKTLLIILLMAAAGISPQNSYRVFLIGDSTMADKPLIDNPEHGWGQMLPAYFSKNVRVFNHAKNGRSTKSFLSEGRWDVVKNQLQPGDYLFIQFGHNDSKKEDTTRFADPHTDYRNNLLRFVREAQEKQALPVLLTPVNRRNFDSTGSFVDKHGDYPDVVRSLAKELQLPLIDLHTKSKALFQKLGDAESKKLFLVSVQPNLYRSLPDGKSDNTHFTRAGAGTVAGLVIEGVKELGLDLAKEIQPQDELHLPGTGKVIGLDYYYNSEWKLRKDSTLFRFHYLWEDTMDSGFSELAKIFDRLGADTDTLISSPTETSLRRFSVYIIVDPDTPKETADPKYILTHDADVIEQWVKEGGILVLMGNDKGNAEFEHLNGLANRFGIRFNEDLHFDVKNNVYDQGKVTELPQHPLFSSVSQIFIKQVSSLMLREPARPILTKHNVTVMAEANIGKGKVIAIGDPWLYNEYIDNRRVPSGYENYSAAESFARWLSEISRKVR